MVVLSRLSKGDREVSLGAGRLVLGECGGVEAEGLALIGGERGPVALEVSGNAATGGARTIAERLDASLPLELCCPRAHNVSAGRL